MELDKMEQAHRAQILQTLRQIPCGVPAGWSHSVFAVGGLTHIGFSEQSPEKLVCISSQGQSVIDCATGEIQFCDENYDEYELIALAEPLGDEVIRLAGISGGGLRLCTKRGESLSLISLEYPKSQIVYASDFQTPFLSPAACAAIWNDYEPLAYGFSPCGNYIAIACSSDVTLFRRLTPLEND